MDIEEEPLFVRGDHSAHLRPQHQARNRRPPLLQTLEQDYVFVWQFVSFLANVLLKACKVSDDLSDMEVILCGLASLHDELAWFKREAVNWNVQLSNVAVQKENDDYFRFLGSLM